MQNTFIYKQTEIPKSLTNHTEKLNHWSANIKIKNDKEKGWCCGTSFDPNTLQYTSVRVSFIVLAPTSVNVSNNLNFSPKSIEIKQRKIDIYGV